MLNRDPVTVDIVRLHADGYGLSADGKYAVFGALPGERVVVEPFTRRKRRIFSRTLSVESAAGSRVTPICEFAGVCGGCNLQHLDPSFQLERKQKFLVDTLAGNVPGQVMAPLIGPVSAYRTKARLGVKFVEKKGRVLVGFREKMSPYIAEISRCEVLAPPLGDMIPDLEALIGSLDARARIPQIEVATSGGQAAMVFRHLDPLSSADLGLLERFSRDHDIQVYLQPGGPDSVTRLAPSGGEERLYYALPAYDLTFAFHPLDFTQINQSINRDMVALALRLLELAPSDHVADFFCGIGNFTLPIARKAASVIGVEGSASAVARGYENARRNGIENCRFLVQDLFARDLEFDLSGTNKVLLDPPRSGAEVVCEKLASSNVERVVYVSCNPVTLARDARTLVRGGFRPETTGVIDMFPHTAHVESIACFLR